MIRLVAIALPLSLLAPPVLAQTSLIQTSQVGPTRLVLNAADKDGDGVVSPAEAAHRLAVADVRELPATEPTDWYRTPPEPVPDKPDGLSMKRRFVPASGFELQNERNFEEALRKRR
jgi:hypothetical protein